MNTKESVIEEEMEEITEIFKSLKINNKDLYLETRGYIKGLSKSESLKN